MRHISFFKSFFFLLRFCSWEDQSGQYSHHCKETKTSFFFLCSFVSDDIGVARHKRKGGYCIGNYTIPTRNILEGYFSVKKNQKKKRCGFSPLPFTPSLAVRSLSGVVVYYASLFSFFFFFFFFFFLHPCGVGSKAPAEVSALTTTVWVLMNSSLAISTMLFWADSGQHPSRTYTPTRCLRVCKMVLFSCVGSG